MTEQELYEQDCDNRINADMPEISLDEWRKQLQKDDKFYEETMGEDHG